MIKLWNKPPCDICGAKNPSYGYTEKHMLGIRDNAYKWYCSPCWLSLPMNIAKNIKLNREILGIDLE